MSKQSLHLNYGYNIYVKQQQRCELLYHLEQEQQIYLLVFHRKLVVKSPVKLSCIKLGC